MGLSWASLVHRTWCSIFKMLHNSVMAVSSSAPIKLLRHPIIMDFIFRNTLNQFRKHLSGSHSPTFLENTPTPILDIFCRKL